LVNQHKPQIVHFSGHGSEKGMFCEYIQAAISKAVYEVIDDQEPYSGEVP
jgi:hypothetical protein